MNRKASVLKQSLARESTVIAEADEREQRLNKVLEENNEVLSSVHEYFDPMKHYDDESKRALVQIVTNKLRQICRLDPELFKGNKTPFGLKIDDDIDEKTGMNFEQLQKAYQGLLEELQMSKREIKRLELELGRTGRESYSQRQSAGQLTHSQASMDSEDDTTPGGGVVDNPAGGEMVERQLWMVEGLLDSARHSLSAKRKWNR